MYAFTYLFMIPYKVSRKKKVLPCRSAKSFIQYSVLYFSHNKKINSLIHLEYIEYLAVFKIDTASQVFLVSAMGIWLQVTEIQTAVA